MYAKMDSTTTDPFSRLSLAVVYPYMSIYSSINIDIYIYKQVLVYVAVSFFSLLIQKRRITNGLVWNWKKSSKNQIFRFSLEVSLFGSLLSFFIWSRLTVATKPNANIIIRVCFEIVNNCKSELQFFIVAYLSLGG